MRKGKIYNCFNCGDEFWGNSVKPKYCAQCRYITALISLAQVHNGRAIKFGASGKLTGKELFDAYHAQGRHCLCCGNPEIVYDHVVPLSMGGTNTIDNIQLLCSKCNRRKCKQATDYRI